MDTTDKLVCREIAALLVKHGIKDIILSPGTRNAPLIMAVARNELLRHHVVIDERSAAFVGLGMAVQSQCPVALICTSGTAMLNYAPALAEAFYREIPLIVITADRPAEWIDQDDCQTIHQAGAFGKLVKCSVDIDAENVHPAKQWMANRQINDAIICATSGRSGPVHINVQLDAPLTNTCDVENEGFRAIECIQPEPTVSTSFARALASELAAPRKVMIVVGFNAPNQKLNRALSRLADLKNVVVVAEAQSNLHFPRCVQNVESIFSAYGEEKRKQLAPDVVITIGGSILCQTLKTWLRSLPGLRHWHVGVRGTSTDCFKCLERRIELPAHTFMPQLASGMQIYKKAASNYATIWHNVSIAAQISHSLFVNETSWCDLKAIDAVINAMPLKCNLHISNGTAIRYAQLADYYRIHRVECNRGVSGIDGCTSTAIGAAMAYNGMTVLLTGDMSAQYDIGALAISNIPASFRMIVISNGGGGIFKFIKPTSSLPECNECFAANVHLPLQQLANGFNFNYFEAKNQAELDSAMSDFFATSDRPAILNIITSGDESAQIFKQYLTRYKSIK